MAEKGECCFAEAHTTVAGSDGTRNPLCAEGNPYPTSFQNIPIKVVRFRIFSFLLQTFFFFNFLQEYKLQTFEAKTAILFLRLTGREYLGVLLVGENTRHRLGGSSPLCDLGEQVQVPLRAGLSFKGVCTCLLNPHQNVCKSWGH